MWQTRNIRRWKVRKIKRSIYINEYMRQRRNEEIKITGHE